MTCDTARDRMLEADPEALQGRGPSELAAHIDGCPRCARVAAAILTELDDVDARLSDFAGAGDLAAADAAADAALAASRSGDDADDAPLRDAPGPNRGSGGARPPRRTWTRGAWVPLAAAAALAALLLARDDGSTPGPTPAGPGLTPRVSVTPPADRRAAIMETANPNITIVWLYQREGT